MTKKLTLQKNNPSKIIVGSDVAWFGHSDAVISSPMEDHPDVNESSPCVIYKPTKTLPQTNYNPTTL